METINKARMCMNKNEEKPILDIKCTPYPPTKENKKVYDLQVVRYKKLSNLKMTFKEKLLYYFKIRPLERRIARRMKRKKGG